MSCHIIVIACAILTLYSVLIIRLLQVSIMSLSYMYCNVHTPKIDTENYYYSPCSKEGNHYIHTLTFTPLRCSLMAGVLMVLILAGRVPVEVNGRSTGDPERLML